MAGCCGGKTARRWPPKAAPVVGTDRVLLVYTGDRDRLFSVRGPATWVKYYVSSQPEERVVAVYVEDVAGMTGKEGSEWVAVEGEG